MGRPYKVINWNKVDECLMSGHTAVEIAAHLGVGEHAFYRAIKREKKMDFATYAHQLLSKGDGLLKLAQFMKAIGATKNGDTTLLLHLGKFRLGQVEVKQDATVPNEDYLNLQCDYMKVLHELNELKNAIQSKTANQLHGSDSPI